MVGTYEQFNEHRCIKCNKLLALGDIHSTRIEIKCPRCREYNFFFDKEPDQVVITDLEGNVLYANESLAKVTGYEVHEMLGNKPSLWGGQMPEEFYKGIWTKIKGGEVAVVMVTNKRKNGELYDAKLRISPILDQNGDPKFFIGIETVTKKA